MKRPKINDYKPSEIHCGDDMAKWYMDFANEQELYIDELESRSNQRGVSDGEIIELLEEIKLGNGAYDTNQLKHASNCIENMKELADEVIKKLMTPTK